ncbi:MAG: heavy-metal-associated domain-containing protein [Mariprofundaceae bacterium]
MRTLRFLLMISFIMGAFPNSMAWAEEMTTAVIQVDGLSCPFCTYGLEKQLKKVDGVESVSINMKDGKAIITMQQHVDDNRLRQAVEKAGFTARNISHL